jgi:hypothetical protein
MENKLMTAKSYSNCERIGEPFEKNGKLYQKVKEKCDRCNGRGEYWWGAMINGRPQFSGTCYACNGARYFIKEVRLYTEEEYNKMESAKEKTRQKKEAEREAKMKAEYAQKKEEWIQKNGFNAEGVTFVITGDSYSIKNELKENGWHFDPVRRWYKNDPTGYEDRCVSFTLDELIDFSAWGTGTYKTEAKSIVDNKLAAAEPKIETSFYGEVGGKVKDIYVELIRKFSFDGRYGVTNVYNMLDKEGHLFVWFTSTIQPFEIHDHLVISSATIKDHKEYKDDKQTVITRARLKTLDEAGMSEVDYFDWTNETLNG